MKPIQSSRASGTMKQAWIFPAALIFGTLCAVAMPRPSAASSEPHVGETPTTWDSWWRAPGLNLKTRSDEHGIQITETNWGRPLHAYQLRKDPDGRIHETYEEEGIAKPIDDHVRLWIEATLKRAEPPTPPAPPLPPEPPEPPAPPAFDRSAAGREILMRIQNDARLVAMVGTPMQAAPTIEGAIHQWGPGEPSGSTLLSRISGIEVDVTVSISGPKGAATVHAKGQLKQGQWTFSALDAQATQSGMHLDLLSQ
jgi:hypothetical protein